ncbi:MAG: 23S rRNA (pseudouridine(1915)-N(3))-methyltransferase RlmH [Clostridia bacterium]
MPVTLVCVGKLREKFYADAANEYLKRLSRLMPLTVVELPDEREPLTPSDALSEAVLRREGERILQRIAPQDYVIALCIDGTQCPSEALAEKISTLFTRGRSNITFVIGGSLGLHAAVVARANEKFSMSKLTFPHQLARIMLLEQLFRAAKINAGERYHK